MNELQSSGSPAPPCATATRLLAVDPDSDYRYLLGSRLRNAGYDTVLAESGEEALASLQVEGADCVLIACELPSS